MAASGETWSECPSPHDLASFATRKKTHEDAVQDHAM